MISEMVKKWEAIQAAGTDMVCRSQSEAGQCIRGECAVLSVNRKDAAKEIWNSNG